ncbi:MAG: DMT family transporter [Saprospiraceae bacterium]
MSEITTTSRSTTIGFAILILLSITWGASFILIKKGLLAFSPMQVASLRIGIAGIAFLPFFIFNFKKIDWSQLQPLLIVGFAGSALPALLFSIAQTQVSSSVAGVLNSMTPIFVLIQGVLFYGLILTRNNLLGVVLGFLGASLLIIGPSYFMTQLEEIVVAEDKNEWYALLLILATYCYALSGNTIQKHFQNTSAINLSAAAYCLVAPVGILYLLFSDFINILQTHPDAMVSLGAIVFLSLIGTVAASVLFFKLIQMTSALFASTVAFLIPIVAIGFGFLDGEQVTIYHFLGMAMILFGVYITRKKKKILKKKGVNTSS